MDVTRKRKKDHFAKEEVVVCSRIVQQSLPSARHTQDIFCLLRFAKFSLGAQNYNEAMERLLVVGILVAILLFESEAHLDEMHLTCRPQAGCEVFDVCTRSAMLKLQSEIEYLVENKLKLSDESLKKSLVELQRTSNDRSIDTEGFRVIMKAEIEKKMTELEESFNKTILDMKKSAVKRSQEERNELDEILERKVEERVTKITGSVKKAEGKMGKTSKKEMEVLRNETRKLMNAKVMKVSRRWTASLGNAKIDFTAIVDKATATINNRIKKVEVEVAKIWLNVNASLSSMNNEMNARLRQFVKDKISRSDVEQMIDAKVKEANFGWGSFFGDEEYLDGDYGTDTKGEEQDTCTVSYEGKCFWIVEPDLAVSFANAEYECQRKGGRLGNIYSKAHIDLLNSYLRSLISVKRMYIDVWTGMSINALSGEVFYNDGSIAKFLEWEPGSPAIGKSFFSWTGIYLISKKEENSVHQGMVNSSPESIRDGVLCEK